MKKKTYVTPKLTVKGDIASLTQFNMGGGFLSTITGVGSSSSSSSTGGGSYSSDRDSDWNYSLSQQQICSYS